MPKSKAGPEVTLVAVLTCSNVTAGSTQGRFVSIASEGFFGDASESLTDPPHRPGTRCFHGSHRPSRSEERLDRVGGARARKRPTPETTRSNIPGLAIEYGPTRVPPAASPEGR